MRGSRLLNHTACSNWRCCHGAIVVPPVAPEVLPVDPMSAPVAPEVDSGPLTIRILWPAVVHAVSYTVHVFESFDFPVERLTCTVPASPDVAVEDLFVGGLANGCSLSACVSSVAPCGCRSMSSEWAHLVPAQTAIAAISAVNVADGVDLKSRPQHNFASPVHITDATGTNTTVDNGPVLVTTLLGTPTTPVVNCECEDVTRVASPARRRKRRAGKGNHSDGQEQMFDEMPTLLGCLSVVKEEVSEDFPEDDSCAPHGATTREVFGELWLQLLD